MTDDTIEIRADRRSLLLPLAVFPVFVAAGVFLVVSPESVDSSLPLLRYTVVRQVVGAVLAGLMCFMIVMAGWMLVTRQPVLVLSEDGVLYRWFGSWPWKVEWAALRGVDTTVGRMMKGRVHLMLPSGRRKSISTEPLGWEYKDPQVVANLITERWRAETGGPGP